MSLVEIPKCNKEFDNYPCWVPVVDSTGVMLKPVIICNCGQWCGIGLHHVHEDGTVMASFYHLHHGREDNPGCGWHVFLKLLDYDCGEFLPEKSD